MIQGNSYSMASLISDTASLQYLNLDNYGFYGITYPTDKGRFYFVTDDRPKPGKVHTLENGIDHLAFLYPNFN